MQLTDLGSAKKLKLIRRIALWLVEVEKNLILKLDVTSRSNMLRENAFHLVYDREKLQRRLAKLAGGVAVIKVGGAAEVRKSRKKIELKMLEMLLEQLLKNS